MLTGKRQELYSQRAEELARDGPARGICSQTEKLPTPTPAKTNKLPATGRLKQVISAFNLPFCLIEVSDGLETHADTGRCDNGSVKSIVSPALAQETDFKGIERMVAITSSKIQVALKETGELATFSFSRVWHVPHLVPELYSGKMALLNVTFLVANVDNVWKTCF